ncbi:hypothetical protein DNJ95_12675 [Stutzerimonas kirkiae]|uniref:GtrA/DPMS transmembrane domain-containing protein n=1 Tax=Stutzerimonas kirkiae TaxID=2211392 RepID=A0A4Q9R3E4_9GAMM|nr:GtrA family protein [Stutzerimonas kirkiae]TBU92862.1 hypothetical protein DNJ96_14730 [Stutzerimonas kirkiae]TBV01325.1 hypothetical protein DNJ95_12675 [Stutzerimonas kirkiae]
MVDGARFRQAGRTWGQLLRFAVLGVAFNAGGYMLYLLLTWLGVAPKLTVSLLYPLGALAGFLGNRKLTFSYRGSLFDSGLRYALAHTMGYALNLALLAVFADRLGYPHQWVQAVAVFVVAGFLFVAFKCFVFRHATTEARS